METKSKKAKELKQLVVSKTERANYDLKPDRPEVAPKNPAAVALGRLGGMKGGKARAIRLSEERRREIAQNAARARWAKTAEPEEE
jgi:hypothetical protein